MRWLLATVLCILATVPTTADAHSCTCKYDGGDVKQGETACINTTKGKSLARCDMMLNNSSWTVLDQSCDSNVSLKMSPIPKPATKPSST